MRTTCTMTVSLPPAMVEEFEKVRKAENRTRSELVREALRTYFSFCSRFPEITPSKGWLKAIYRGRAAFDRGEYVTLNEAIHGVESTRNQARTKRPRKASRKGSKAD
jgi:CopG family transcriptional regulator / antitoxin EndoAI